MTTPHQPDGGPATSKEKATMDCVVRVGNTITKDALEPMADAILRILEARADQETIRHALTTFGRVTEIQNLSFSDSLFVGGDYYEAGAAPAVDPEDAP